VQTYQGFYQYGMGYLEGHLDYRKSEGDDEERLREIRQNLTQSIGELSRGIWGQTPWNTPI